MHNVLGFILGFAAIFVAMSALAGTLGVIAFAPPLQAGAP